MNLQVISNEIQFRNNGIEDSTRKAYTTGVKQYKRYIQDNGLEVGFESIKEWLSQFTIYSTYNLKRQSVIEHYQEYFKQLDPMKRIELQEGFKNIKRKQPKREVLEGEYCEIKEVYKIAAAAPRKVALMIRFLFWTGCRISEALSILIEDSEVNGSVKLRIRDAKNNKERFIHIQKRIYNQILNEYKGETYLFESRNGTPLNRSNVSNDIKRAAKGIKKKVSAHTLRHSKACYLRDRKGMTADKVSKVLGNSELVVLQSYFHYTPDAESQGIK